MTEEQLEAYMNYTMALEKTNKLTSLDGKLIVNISMNAAASGMAQTVYYNFNMKVSNAHNPSSMKMRLDGVMSMTGQDVTVEPIEGYKSFPEQSLS